MFTYLGYGLGMVVLGWVRACDARLDKVQLSYKINRQVLYLLLAALVTCNLFICDFGYMRLRNGLNFSGTYPLIYSYLWSFYMRIHYMQGYFSSPYLLHITRTTCTYKIRFSIELLERSFCSNSTIFVTSPYSLYHNVSPFRKSQTFIIKK